MRGREIGVLGVAIVRAIESEPIPVIKPALVARQVRLGKSQTAVDARLDIIVFLAVPWMTRLNFDVAAAKTHLIMNYNPFMPAVLAAI